MGLQTELAQTFAKQLKFERTCTLPPPHPSLLPPSLLPPVSVQMGSSSLLFTVILMIGSFLGRCRGPSVKPVC